MFIYYQHYLKFNVIDQGPLWRNAVATMILLNNFIANITNITHSNFHENCVKPGNPNVFLLRLKERRSYKVNI